MRLQVLCNREEVVWKFGEQCVAHLLQRPGEKLLIALFIVGPPGCGKGWFFITLLSHLVGLDYFIALSDPDQLLSKFNAWAAGKVTFSLVPPPAPLPTCC